jgi:biotin carboxyl carrier protein
MKYKVTVNHKTYEVEIEDINARPIIARVEGQRFEVAYENGSRSEPAPEAKTEAKTAAPSFSAPVSSAAISTNEIVAPLPGTVVEVFVKAGEQIETGQVILVIEAMKMKNSIRSTRGGILCEVLVGVGQSVAHKQTLVRFSE